MDEGEKTNRNEDDQFDCNNYIGFDGKTIRKVSTYTQVL